MKQFKSYVYIRRLDSITFFRWMHSLISSISFNPDPPSLTTRPSKQTVLQGTNVTMSCSATGNPIPKITWFKDGKAIGSGETLSLNAQRNVAGKYWCSADNGVGEAVNASADIDVHCEFLYSRILKVFLENWGKTF